MEATVIKKLLKFFGKVLIVIFAIDVLVSLGNTHTLGLILILEGVGSMLVGAVLLSGLSEASYVRRGSKDPRILLKGYRRVVLSEYRERRKSQEAAGAMLIPIGAALFFLGLSLL